MQNTPQYEQRIETYKNAGQFQSHQRKLARDGWIPLTTTMGTRNRNLAGKLLVPFGLFTKPAQIVVTYQRPVNAVAASAGNPNKPPPGLSFKEQVRWHAENNKRAK
jgi:hypothetical protein